MNLKKFEKVSKQYYFFGYKMELKGQSGISGTRKKCFNFLTN